MKKIFFGALFLLVISGTVLSQPEKSPEQGNEEETVEKIQPPEKPAEETKKPGEREWPPPFEPSENVGADSEISFPTDI